MKLAIVVYPGMTALDAIGPYEVFNCIEEIELQFVYKEVGPIVTDSNVLVLGATRTFRQLPAPDVLLVPGSSASTGTMMADDEVTGWIRSAHHHTRYTTSVCSGSLILGAAGVLEGVPATTHWAAMPVLKRLGAEPRPDERVVQQGKIITAAGVSAGIDMALHLVGVLFGEERAQAAQLLIEYDPRPPFDAGHITKASASVRRRAQKDMLKAGANPRDLVSLPKVLLRRWRERWAGRSSW